MAPSDLSVLLDMGFEKERAELAVKKSGGLQGALEWLEANQDKSLDEIRVSAPSNTGEDETDPTIEPEELKPGEVANSLVCNDCGRKFRSTAQAEFHASKTEHQNFSESIEEIAPLTEEEKKAKLEELRQKMAEKRARQTQTDREENKKNEAIRRKATQEVQDIKEDLRKKEQIKEAAAKRKEKQEELAVKERIRAQIKATQEERRLKAAREKAAREGQALPQEPDLESQSASAGSVGSAKPASTYSESRLRLQLPSGNVQKTFPVETTLFEVAAALEQESGASVESFTQTFPRKTFSQGVDFGLTLKEAGLVPSAVLIVR
ncbi:MAG: hypothetical protein M1839_008757 [Geoglossum umbratile]|nr:MAG: hypothetical protein M1839_008757 [Geoglossum umbratile]